MISVFAIVSFLSFRIVWSLLLIFVFSLPSFVVVFDHDFGRESRFVLPQDRSSVLTAHKAKGLHGSCGVEAVTHMDDWLVRGMSTLIVVVTHSFRVLNLYPSKGRAIPTCDCPCNGHGHPL